MGPGLITAGVSKVARPFPVQPTDPSADTAGLAAAADRPDAGAVEDIRAVSGPTRTVLTAASGQERETQPVAAPPATAASDPRLPAATLPLIAAAITEEVGRAASESRRGTPVSAGGPSADGPLRVLRIQLRPEDLGIVTVELRLIGGQLETHLRASRPETAALLRRDAAVLTDLLKQADYRPEVTIGQARPTDTGGTPSQGQPAFADGGARPGQEGGRQRQPEQHRIAAHEGERTDEAVRPRDGSVYL